LQSTRRHRGMQTYFVAGTCGRIAALCTYSRPCYLPPIPR
jgi:hypothetical protein